MTKRPFALLSVLFFLLACSPSRKAGSENKELLMRLQSHVTYLADDKLEGRRTGTPGEELALQYISRQFTEIGLSPRGTEHYSQSFVVNDGRQTDAFTEMNINGNMLKTGDDYFLLAFGGDGFLESDVSLSVQEAAVPWFFDLKETLAENAANPHFDLVNYVYTNAGKAAERGAGAVILYNTSATDDKLAFDPKERRERLKIPVLYLKKETVTKYLGDPTATLRVKLRTGISEKTRVGHNVVGYIDNGAPLTVILGAHYDHLGYGEDGNSMVRTGEKLVHNGADDNASGTAALIELARMVKNSKLKKHNYLFIAFSGEELGLYGSKYYTDNATIDLKTVNYMINMDMVGRLNDSSRVVTIGGYGTSPFWGTYFPERAAKQKDLVYKYDSSGTGPSDHTSFYRKDIPVLFYFTGLHTDYHRPSDDAVKINYTGQARIVNDIYQLLAARDAEPRLTFTKTRETQTTTQARFRVTIGIMADYTYSGNGVKVDGVTEGRAAQKAGMAAGDIIVQLGSYSITGMESYMKALGSFNKGDKTTVKFRRGETVLERPIEF